MKPNQFYESVSTTSVFKNGKGLIKTHKVHIHNGKGYKQVSVTQRGKTQRKKKVLTQSEMKCIQTCKFKKGLFSDCVPECV